MKPLIERFDSIVAKFDPYGGYGRLYALSILICTIPERKDKLNQLLANLNAQNTYTDVEILVCTDNKEMSIGEKRNKILEAAKGDFIVFIDDDDEVSEDYIKLIYDTIINNPDIDCIGIQGTITFDGVNEKQWYISKDFGSWYEANNIFYRTPNHISPVKRTHALKTGFPSIQFGEDSDYSHRLLPLLQREEKINKNIYIYKYASVK
jgi:glycosyltransferase involved in cell wall biosynthesis